MRCGGEGGLNNFLKAAPCFSFQLTFLKIQLFFSILILLPITLKCYNLPDNSRVRLQLSHFLSIWNIMKIKIKHGTTQKVCHLIMGFFTPFNFVTLCQFYSNTSLVLFTMLDFIKELLNVWKYFLHIWLLRHNTIYQKR